MCPEPSSSREETQEENHGPLSALYVAPGQEYGERWSGAAVTNRHDGADLIDEGMGGS